MEEPLSLKSGTVKTTATQRTRRWPKRILWGLLIIILVPALWILFLAIYDISPPEDADMLPSPILTDETAGNPLAKLLSSLKDDQFPINWPAQTSTAPTSPEVLVEASELLSAHVSSFRALENLLESPVTLWRWPGEPTELQAGKVANLDGLTLCHSLAQANLLRARHEAELGSSERIIKILLQNLHFTRSLQRVPGPVIHYMIGPALQKKTLETMSVLLPLHNISASELLLLQEALPHLEPSAADFQQSLKHEYVFSKTAFLSLTDREKRRVILQTTKAADPDGPDLPEWAHVFYKPNLSLQYRLDWSRKVYKALDISLLQGLREFPDTRGDSMTLLQIGIRPNPVGTFYEFRSTQTYLRILERSQETIAKLRHAAIILALRRYELEHGKLPQTLQELTPKFVVSVPLDPFDESPMKWNPRQKTLHSVGSDFQDQGGNYDKNLPDTLQRDLISSYWWANDERSR